MDIPRRALSHQFVRSLRPAPSGKQLWIADDIVPGLLIRVDDRGRRTFHLSKALGGKGEEPLGVFGTMTLGDARLTARLRIAGLEAIQTAKGSRGRGMPAPTFAQVCGDYIEQYASRKKAAHSARAITLNVLIPKWGNRPLASITRSEVVDLVEEIKGRGTPHAARLALWQVRSLYLWAIGAGRYGIEDSPCDLINSKRIIGVAAHARDRVLSDPEIVALWRAGEWFSYPFGDIYRLLLLTGQRRGEVAAARWSEFDLQNAEWTIPPERHKAGVTHSVMLPTEAVRILARLPRWEGTDLVFSHNGGRSSLRGNFNQAKRSLSFLMHAALGGPVASPWVTQDIRRTVRTKLAELGVNDVVAEIVLGHGPPKSYRLYVQIGADTHAIDVIQGPPPGV